MESVSFSGPLIAAFTFGVIFVITMLVLAIKFPRPTDFQYTVFRIVLAIAVAGVAAPIPGLLDVKVADYITASGTIGVFVIIYFFSPASLVLQNSGETVVERLSEYWKSVNYPTLPLDAVDSAKAMNALTQTTYLWKASENNEKSTIYREIWATAYKPWFDSLESSGLYATDGKKYSEHLKKIKQTYLEIEKWAI